MGIAAACERSLNLATLRRTAHLSAAWDVESSLFTKQLWRLNIHLEALLQQDQALHPEAVVLRYLRQLDPEARAPSLQVGGWDPVGHDAPPRDLRAAGAARSRVSGFVRSCVPKPAAGILLVTRPQAGGRDPVGHDAPPCNLRTARRRRARLGPLGRRPARTYVLSIKGTGRRRARPLPRTQLPHGVMEDGRDVLPPLPLFPLSLVLLRRPSQ